MTGRYPLLAALAVTAAASAMAPNNALMAKSEANAESDRGRALYVSRGCYQCHGLVGQGSVLSGPALAGRGLTPMMISAYARHPKGVMPSYGTQALSDAELHVVATYIAELKGGKPAQSIPQLAPYLQKSPANPAPAQAAPRRESEDGERLFAANCAICHGTQHQGGLGPSLRDVAAKYSADALVSLLENPPAGMPKLSPQPLSREQATILSKYLVAQSKSAFSR